MSDQTFAAAIEALEHRVRAMTSVDELPALHAEMQRCEAIGEQELAAKDREIAQKEAKLAELVTDDTIRRALAKRGVSPGYVRASAALFTARHQVEAEPGDDRRNFQVFVRTQHGRRLSIGDAIDVWLEGEQGRAFLPKREAPAHFLTQLRLVR